MNSTIDFAEMFKYRTKKFAIDIIMNSKDFPKTTAGFIVCKQLIRAATSVAANYRAVCRARSNSEFYSKLCIVVEEADESAFWLEIAIEADILNKDATKKLLKEANEILAVAASSKKTAGKNNSQITHSTIQ